MAREHTFKATTINAAAFEASLLTRNELLLHIRSIENSLANEYAIGNHTSNRNRAFPLNYAQAGVLKYIMQDQGAH